MVQNIFMKKCLFLSLFACFASLIADDKTPSPAERSMSKAAPVEQSTHTLSEILGGGRVVVLEDGTEWEVHPDDVDKSGGWLGPADVVLSPSTDSTYKYKIFNTWTNSSVRVRSYTPSSK
jgi:hypothetical protein